MVVLAGVLDGTRVFKVDIHICFVYFLETLHRFMVMPSFLCLLFFFSRFFKCRCRVG